MTESAHHVALPDGYSDKMRELADALTAIEPTQMTKTEYFRAVAEVVCDLHQLAGAFEGRYDG